MFWLLFAIPHHMPKIWFLNLLRYLSFTYCSFCCTITCWVFWRYFINIPSYKSSVTECFKHCSKLQIEPPVTFYFYILCICCWSWLNYNKLASFAELKLSVINVESCDITQANSHILDMSSSYRHIIKSVVVATTNF